MANIVGTTRNDLLLGTPGDDFVLGLSGSDVLTGETGNDLLDGGVGADYMRGGSGNDSYRVDDPGDRVVELGNPLPLSRVSVAASGIQANDTSFDPAISADGRFVAFGSLASNLVPGEANVVQDIFVRDLQTEAIVRASTSVNGLQGNDTSSNPSIAADGRFVAFLSNATNLVPGDTNFVTDVFVKDLATGAIVRASLTGGGVQANDNSSDAAISANGRFVAFGSLASNLAPGDRNVGSDVYVKDLQTGAVAIASSDSRGISSVGGSADAAISGDGRLVAFTSNAFDLVPGFSGAVNGIIVKDLSTGAVSLASVAANGIQANDSSAAPSVSADGRFVAFASRASNLVPGDGNFVSDIFVKDLQTGAIVRASTDASGVQANDNSDLPQISPDGSYVVFRSFASNLVPGDNGATADIFVKDLLTGAIARVSLGQFGTDPNDNSLGAAISADAGVVAFRSSASNLLPGEANSVPDVFAVTPPLGSAGGIDTAQSAVSFVLPPNVENLTLVGAANINGTGNALSNTLVGNDGANALLGGTGNDGLYGGPGNDLLDGGEGTDLASYVGLRAEYEVLVYNGQLVVGSVREGRDLLTSIETLSFADQALSATQANGPLEYIASYADLMAAFGANAAAGFNHFISSGYAEGRTVGFEGLEYIASYGDLVSAFGVNAEAGANHYIQSGRFEGRSISFDGLDYIASYGDLIHAFGANADAGAIHYIGAGRAEGRQVTFEGLEYIASYGDLIHAFGANADAGAVHYIGAGHAEGRQVRFDGLEYIASYGDLINAFRSEVATSTHPEDIGANHYIVAGCAEQRSADLFNAAQYLANYADLQLAFGNNVEAATVHYITQGYFEGRIDHPLA